MWVAGGLGEWGEVDEVLFIKIVEEGEVGTKTEVRKRWLRVHVASEVSTGLP